MIFMQDFSKYGVEFKVKMLSVKEIMELTDEKSKTTDFQVAQMVIHDKDGKPVFKTEDEVKEQLPPSVITEIVLLALNSEKKQ